MFVCKHCKKEFNGLSVANKANHSRWCKDNPNREKYVSTLAESRKLIDQSSRQNQGHVISELHRQGFYKNASKKSVDTKRKNGTLNHTEKTKEKIRDKALSSNHRRLLKSTRLYTQIDGTQVLLDSSWEEVLALRLDSLGIKWIRPKESIKWVDPKGKEHNYFPDFYLPDFDVFLDPKNPYALRVQKEKLEIIQHQLPNLKILTSLEECRSFSLQI